MDGIAKDLGRTNVNVQKLQVGLEIANENAAALREGQKLINTNVQTFQQEQVKTQTTMITIRETIEKGSEVEIAKLQELSGRLQLDLQQLTMDYADTKQDVQEHKEALRTTNRSVSGVQDELTKTNTV